MYVQPKLISCLVTLLTDLSLFIIIWRLYQGSWFQEIHFKALNWASCFVARISTTEITYECKISNCDNELACTRSWSACRRVHKSSHTGQRNFYFTVLSLYWVWFTGATFILGTFSSCKCNILKAENKFLLAILCIYNIYKCSNILLGNDPHYAMLNYPDGTASLQLNPLPPAMTVAGVNNQLVENRSQYQQAMMTRSASNPEYGRNLYKPFHQIQLGWSNFSCFYNAGLIGRFLRPKRCDKSLTTLVKSTKIGTRAPIMI